MVERTALDDVREAVKGKIYRDRCFEKPALIITRLGHSFWDKPEYLYYPIAIHDLTNGKGDHLFNDYDGLERLHQISHQDLTPDEAYNLARYERSEGLEQTTSAQTQPSCRETGGLEVRKITDEMSLLGALKEARRRPLPEPK